MNDSMLVRGKKFKELTTMKIGGEIKYLYYPKTQEELIEFIKEYKGKYFIIGNGSNIIPSDKYFDGIVVCLKKIEEKVERNGDIFIIPAGYMLPKISHHLAVLGFNAAFMSAIPGTIGGAIYMNSGAYKKEISDVLIKADFIDEDGNLITLTKDELQFKYRYSKMQKEKLICLRGYFLFEKNNQVFRKIKKYYNIRKRSQPISNYSSGSVFKNLDDVNVWKLIDSVGLRGYQVNDAKVSNIHTNFIINLGNANACDVRQVYKEMKKRVFEKYGIELKSEWIFINW